MFIAPLSPTTLCPSPGGSLLAVSIPLSALSWHKYAARCVRADSTTRTAMCCCCPTVAALTCSSERGEEALERTNVGWTRFTIVVRQTAETCPY